MDLAGFEWSNEFLARESEPVEKGEEMDAESSSHVRLIPCISSLINMIAGLNGKKNGRFQSARRGGKWVEVKAEREGKKEWSRNGLIGELNAPTTCICVLDEITSLAFPYPERCRPSLFDRFPQIARVVAAGVRY